MIVGLAIGTQLKDTPEAASRMNMNRRRESGWTDRSPLHRHCADPPEQGVDKLYDDQELELRLRSQAEPECPAGCFARPQRAKRRRVNGVHPLAHRLYEIGVYPGRTLGL